MCKNFQEFEKSASKLIKKYKTLVVENFVGGQEIQVAVINGKALGAIELKPKRKFYDYKAKYSKSAETLHLMPANLSSKKYKEVLDLAIKAHKALKCRGVTRSDFKFKDNKFYLLEINTQPGMTDLSLVPEIAKYSNISFKNLVKNIIDDASLNR
jgi:D-alanine-D-alanine ligase